MATKGLETKFEKAEESPGFLFWRVANLHQRLQRQALIDEDITPTQFSVLACCLYLQGKSGPPTQALICAQSSLDKMHVSDVTKALLKKKLVVRKPHPSDARSFLIEVTALGQKIGNSAVKKIEAFDERFFAASGGVAELHRLLKKIEQSFAG